MTEYHKNRIKILLKILIKFTFVPPLFALARVSAAPLSPARFPSASASASQSPPVYASPAPVYIIAKEDIGIFFFYTSRIFNIVSIHARSTLLPYFLLLLGLFPLFALSLFLLLPLNLQQRFAPTLQFRLTFLEVLFAFVLK